MVFEQNKDLLFGCHIVTIKICFPDNLVSKEDSTPQGFLPPTTRIVSVSDMLREIYWNLSGIARNLDFIKVGHGANVDHIQFHIWSIGEDVGRYLNGCSTPF
jgi:hypothetical protein